MKNKTPDNYKFAAKLTFVSAFIGIISFFMDDELPKTNITFLSLLLIVALTIALGILMLNNVKWIKNVFLIFMIIGLFGIFLNPTSFFIGKTVMLIIINILSFSLQIYILFLLFKSNKTTTESET